MMCFLMANKLTSSNKEKLNVPILEIMTPFVKDQLVKNIVASLSYTVNFDESMNRVLQNEKMDVQIHYWGVKTSMASTRYFDF